MAEEGVSMREILFRGKRLDNGEWLEGSLWLYGEKARIDDNLGFPRGLCWEEVDPATVGQFTGLDDKNGRRIFEGDLCLCDRHINDSFDKTVFEISFDPLRGYYGESNWGNEFDADSFEMCEVIGNIHDNPELLKGGWA